VTVTLDILALHTAEPPGSLAVGVGPRFEHQVLGSGSRHAPVLLAAVIDLLRRAAISLEALAGIAATTGPGSFTGVRVGLATAQGLAAARGWRVWTCDTLKAVAATRPSGSRPVAVVLDARRGELYAGLFDVRREVPRSLLEPFSAPPATAAARLAAALGALAAHPGEARLVGSGVPLLHALDPAWPEEEPDPVAVPVAVALLRLARAGACRNVAAADLEPIYLRKSDAEVRRDGTLGAGA
jgi:tRNA threonylcarbamoyladenosine biosynthesis protein TsaB